MTKVQAHRITAPSANNCLRPPALLTVTVEEGESVEWIWTHSVDGRSTVTGYRIVPKLPNLLRHK
jgi:hypothetical protein